MLKWWHYSYILAALSVAWACLLLGEPELMASRDVFYSTAALIGCGFLASLVELFRRGRVLIAVNLAQLPLFCLLNYQLFRAFGAEHYQFDAHPGPLDWVQLFGVHLLRAVDVLDALEEYRIDLQNIHHASVFSGLLLVWMHVAVDVFVLSLIWTGVVRLRRRWSKKDPAGASAEHAQPLKKASPLATLLRVLRIVMLAACVALTVWCAHKQAWRPADWLLWPLDQVLRTIDIGDALQIFRWQLHQVTGGIWTVTLAVAFRLTVGVYVAGWIGQLRVAAMGGRGATVEQLMAMLASPIPKVRESACAGLGGLGSAATEAVPALTKALTDADSAVRKEAAQALERICPDKRAWVPGLVVALSDASEEVRRSAAKALSRMGPVAVPALSKALAHDDSRVREGAARALGQIGPAARAAVPALVAALTHEAWALREAAVASLGEIGPAAEAAVPALIRALSDGQWAVRWGATRALGQIGPAAKAAVPALVAALGHEVWTLREEAAATLGQIGRAAEAAVPALIGALSDSHSAVRKAAARALGRIGPAAKGAIPALDALGQGTPAFGKLVSEVIRRIRRQ